MSERHVRRMARLSPPNRVPRKTWEKAEYIEGLARRLGCSEWVIRKWRQRGVSQKWRVIIMDEAAWHNIVLYPDDFDAATFVAERPQWAKRFTGHNAKLNERLEEFGWI